MTSQPTRAQDTGFEHPGMLPAALLGEPRSGDRPRRTARDWVIDILAVMLSLGLGALLLILSQVETPVSDHLVFYDFVLGVISSASVWWRRRFPVQVGLFTAVLSAFSAFAAAASTVGLFTVAVHRRFRTVAIVTAANLAASAVIAVMRPDESNSFWLNMVIGVLVVAVAVAWGMFARARRQVLLSLRDRAERAEAEQQLRVAQARQLERTRIAREMHDVLAHRISLISLHAGALEFSTGVTPEAASASAAVIRQSAHAALEDLREILGVLRAAAPGDEPDEGTTQIERPQPTLTDLPALVEQSRAAGMQLTLAERLEDAAGVPTSLGRTAFRVVQEGLTNAHKHAPYTAVTVRVQGQPGTGLDVEVRNRGSVVAKSAVQQRVLANGAPIPGSGQGLVGLSERATLIGGRVEHGPTADGDFRLYAWLPWPA